jgi:hypothetical protein
MGVPSFHYRTETIVVQEGDAMMKELSTYQMIQPVPVFPFGSPLAYK